MSCIGCNDDGKCTRARCARCCTCGRDIRGGLGANEVSDPSSAGRPPVEHYLRCSVCVVDIVVEPGLELRDDDSGDDFERMSFELASVAYKIGLRASTGQRVTACSSIAPIFEQRWPGRAWFVEIHDAKLERWTQSYQPYGIPRSR